MTAMNVSELREVTDLLIHLNSNSKELYSNLWMRIEVRDLVGDVLGWVELDYEGDYLFFREDNR